jgi:hypothetical protein
VRRLRETGGAVVAAVDNLTSGSQSAEPCRAELLACVVAHSDYLAVHSLCSVEWTKRQRELLQPRREYRRQEPAARYGDRTPLGPHVNPPVGGVFVELDQPTSAKTRRSRADGSTKTRY